MKVWIILLLSLLMTGCSSMSAVQLENESPPLEDAVVLPAIQLTPAEPETLEEIISYGVETVLCSDTKRAESGEHLVTYVFHPPCLTAYQEDGMPIEETEAETDAQLHALAVTQGFNERFEEWTIFKEMPNLEQEAAADLAWHQSEGMEWHGGYYLELDCTIYQTDHLISISGIYLSDTGGAHPNTWRLGWNFDIQEGMFFDPELLCDDTSLQEAVTAEIIRQANHPLEDGTIPASNYWEDYEAIAANWSSYAVIFDEAGMTVIFSPYEIAAYVYGPQEFHIPYAFLEPYLNTQGKAVLGLETKA